MYETEQIEVMALLEPYTGLVVQAFQEAWAYWNEISEMRPVDYMPTTRANLVNDYARDRFKQLLVEHGLMNSIAIMTHGRGDIFVLRAGPVAFRLKKLSPAGRTSNVRTGTSTRFNRQQALLDLAPEVVKLNIGYCLNEAETEIVDFMVARPKADKEVAWTADLAEPMAAPMQPDLEIIMPEAERRPRFRRKTDALPDAAEGGDES